MNKKIVLAVALAVCLVLTIMPIQVSAKQTTLWGMILEMIFPQPSEAENIKILNPVSNPTLRGQWVVEFETEGKGDLEIQAYEGTYFGKEIEFLGLYCGNERIEVEKYFSGKAAAGVWFEGIDNGKIVARNWECDNEKGKLVLLILATGKHHLRFSFLGENVYAKNYADCTGTDVSPCYECDVDEVNVTVYTNQSSSGPHAMTYSSTGGICQHIQGDTDFSTGDNWFNTTNVSFDVTAAGRTTVRIGGPAWRYIASTTSFTTAQSIKVDYYTSSLQAAAAGASVHIIAFDSSGSTDRFCMHFNGSNFRVQTRQNSGPWIYHHIPIPVIQNRWYTAELVWHANGTAEAWIYQSNESRNPSYYYSNSSYPTPWTYWIRSWNNVQYTYLSLFRNMNITQNETWTYSQGYTFCPAEEKYLGFIDSHSEGETSSYEWENLTVFKEETGTNTVSAYSSNLVAESYVLTTDGGVNPYSGSYMIRYNGTYDATAGNDYAYYRIRDGSNDDILEDYVVENGDFLHFCVYAPDGIEDSCGMEINFQTGSCTPAYLRWTHDDQDGYNITMEANPHIVNDWYCLYTNISDKEDCVIDYLSLVQENDQDSTTFRCYYDEIMLTNYLYTVTSYDTDENWCDCNMTATGCNGLSCWNGTNPMEWDAGTSDDCCGDDVGSEYYNFRDEHFSGAELWFDDDTTDDVCCSLDTECVFSGTCYTGNTAFDLNTDGLSEARCYGPNGRWINTDYYQSWCTGAGAGYTWNVSAGDATGDNYAAIWGGSSTSSYCQNRSIEEGGSFVASLHCCCGDDTGENLNIEETYNRAIAFDNDEDACCDTASDCVAGISCYTTQSAGTTDCDLNDGGNDNCSHCYNNGGTGEWLDCDQSDFMDYWCGNVCGPKNGVYTPRHPSNQPNASRNAVYAGEPDVGEYPDQSTLECCGDDVSEFYFYSQADSSMDNGYSTNTSDEACCNASASRCVDSETCFLNGETGNDIDTDGDNDWCNTGTWYDCNTNAQCLNGGTQYECVDNDCDTHIIDGGSGTTCDGANPCLYLQNDTGTSARFDDNGYVDVKGSYSYDQGSLTPPAGSFIIHNSAGTPVLYIDDDGNLATIGRFTYTASPSPSGNNDFIVQDSGATVAGFIDGTNGNMYFKGDLHYNSNF